MGVMGIRISAAQADVIKAIAAIGGDPFFVGGIVRDRIMEIAFGIVKPSKDVDIEVFDRTMEEVIAAIQNHPSVKHVDIVGAKFSVINVRCVDGTDMDISSPRRETKVGMGSSEFEAVADPFMSKQEAASRRDFSMNAVMVRCMTGEIFDFFGGESAIKSKVIRAVGPRFVESPDRMIRAGRFAAQFDFEVDKWIVDMSRAMAAAGEFQTIFAEKMCAEMTKICHAKRPSRAFRFFMDAGFGPFMPEIAAMVNCPQDVRWHPEGDVFEHTMRVMDEMARICDERGITGEERVIMVMGAICHDMGKPSTTNIHEDGSITSEGHAAVGVAIAAQFMHRMGFRTSSMVKHVEVIVERHMDGINVEPTARIVRRWAAKFAPMTIAQFAMITEADASGRDKGRFQPGAAFEAIAIQENCGAQAPVKIIQGRHCIAIGIKPGPQIGQIVEACFQAQMDGVFSDEQGGIAFMKSVINA